MKYSNIQYPGPAVAAVATDPANMPGYMVFDRIVGADCAEGVAQIPGLYGRDWQNITMTERNGVEYLHLRRALYGCRRSRAPLQRCLLLVHSGRRLCPLVSGGFRRRGKTMTVQVPEHGGFAVYDAAGLPVAASWAWGDTPPSCRRAAGWSFRHSRFVLSLTADEEISLTNGAKDCYNNLARR